MLGAALAFAAIWFIALPLLLPLAFGGPSKGAYWVYSAAQAQLTWFNTGFARRELEGTILALFGGEPMFATGMFHLATYVALAATLIWLVLRRRSFDLHTVALGGLVLAILARVGADVGRSDMAVMLCGLAVVVAVRESRWILAALFLCIALAFHESGLIFLGPLVLAAAVESGSWRRWRTASAAAAALVMLAGGVLYVISALAHPDVHALARAIVGKFANSAVAEAHAISASAVYFNLSGARGLAAAMCETREDPSYLVKVASGAGLILLLSAAFRPRRWRLTLAAALIPFALLCIIAIDVGRWAVFGAFTVAALSLLLPDAVGPQNWKAAAAGLLALPLMAGHMGLNPVLTPVPLVTQEAEQLGYKQPSPLEALSRCDPTWRRVVGVTPS